jgi:hypothetical protein
MRRMSPLDIVRATTDCDMRDVFMPETDIRSPPVENLDPSQCESGSNENPRAIGCGRRRGDLCEWT